MNALVMGYRPLWGARRQLAGVQLWLHDQPEAPPDTAHLLHILGEMWGPASPRLLLSPQSPALLGALLAHARHSTRLAIEVRGPWLAQDDSLLRLVHFAASQKVPLVWRGPINALPDEATAACFVTSLLSLPEPSAPGQPSAPAPALLGGQMYEGIHTRLLARNCLDHSGATAIAGWPDDDVLQRLREARCLQPSFEHVQRLIRAVECDHPLDVFEDILSEDPLLSYRLMLHANSLAVSGRAGVDALRRALFILGYDPLKSWLHHQLQHASNEPDLQPVWQSMVMRAQLISQLLDAGVSEDLRSEVYLCGLFSRLHDILGEPLQTALERLPLSSRIPQALLEDSGPYAPSLQIARAQEREDGGPHIRNLCIHHALEHEHINRTLLRQIAAWRNVQPHW